MPKINLAEEAIRNRKVAHRKRVMYYASLGILVVVFGAYALIFLLTTQAEEATETTNQEIANLEAQLKAKEPAGRRIQLFRERLKSVETLLAQHIHWTRVLEELERLTTPVARVTNLKGDAVSKDFEITVEVPTIDAGADLVASLQRRVETNDTPFSSVVVSRLAATSVEPPAPTGFDISLKFKADGRAFVRAALPETPPAPPAPPVSPGEGAAPAAGGNAAGSQPVTPGI